MSSATKMNVFLQRMLRRSDEKLNVEADCGEVEPDDASKTHPKGSWIRRLGNCSPSKYKVSASPMRSTAMKILDASELRNTQPATPNGNLDAFHSPEMPDLESIIREFEMGYLSPKKKETAAADASKQRNFVKKIVAAFEVKYKAYELNEHQRQEREDVSQRSLSGSPNKRRSGIFGSPFKMSREESVNGSPKANVGRRSGIFSTPTKSSPDAAKRSGIFSTPTKSSPDDLKRSGIFSSPLNTSKSSSKDLSSSGSAIYMSPVNLEQRDYSSTDSSFNASDVFKFEREITAKESRSSGQLIDPFNLSFLDETKIVDGVDLDITLPEPEETILLDAGSFPRTSTKMDDLSIDQSIATSQKISMIDKTPKIVGAFLKKPIEVEDTSIDWIPITGKKLPRKRSLKKLLSALTSKRSFEKKKKVLYTPERSVNDESKELQDSGYDEKSCSSSSLTSLISISEVLLHQENSYVEPERRTTLRSFQSKNSLDREDDEDKAVHPISRSKKRLLLTEVPRETLKVDLGPSYPGPIVTMSLDRRTSFRQKKSVPPTHFAPVSKIPKHPFLSDIPKHPFVSLTKMDETEEPNDHLVISPPRTIRNDLYHVEFHRSCEDFARSPSGRSSSSGGSDYDVPRRLSRSESGIPERCESAEKRQGEPVYDTPRSRERPKSSVYEDALSLKRRTAYFPASLVPDFYAFASDAQPHYATVKPRNRRIHLSEDVLRPRSGVRTVEGSTIF